jgi:hypothetical protein
MSRSKNLNRRRDHGGGSQRSSQPRQRLAEPSTPTSSAPQAMTAGQTHAAPAAAPVPASIRRDQQRAIWAYDRVSAAKVAGLLKDYENAVQGFAATVLRNGLAVAASVLERDKGRPGPKFFLTDLADYLPSGIPSGSADDWPSRVRALARLADYMLATRELLALATWLRRACRALRGDEDAAGAPAS